jgi:uncharacterized protein (DUF1501 family)
MNFSRREMLALSAAGLLVPRPLLAAPSGASNRKFLFILCYGGWDASMVFAPRMHVSAADQEEGTEIAEENGITFVDHETRPTVRSFFETFGDRACVVNGMEVPSITHEMCARVVLTGSKGTTADDWPSVVAAHDETNRLLPYLVMSGGQAMNYRYADKVVRIGSAGQLPALLDASAMADSNMAVTMPPPDVQALEQAFLEERIESRLGALPPGFRQRWLDQYRTSTRNGESLIALSDGLSLVPEASSCGVNVAANAKVAFDCFETGHARCAMIQYLGFCNIGWDTHEANYNQVLHYEDLFTYLNEIMADLDTRPGEFGGSLADEVTIAVFSEMGRHPKLNNWQGRDHWTFTSAMLLGAGIRGGQCIGGLDSSALGQPVDLASGETTDSGTDLQAQHLGATFLALADIDPEPFVAPGISPISAVME